MEDLLLQRTTSYDRAEKKVDKILVVLEATETPPVPASIQAQLRMPDDVKGNLGAASALTDDLINLASERPELLRSTGNARDQVQRKVQQARTQAGNLGVSSAQKAGAEDGLMTGCSRNAQVLFDKRPFPHFDGLKQNFQSFRREMIETMKKAKFPPDHKLRELKRCNPKAVHPDIKDLKTLSAVWDFLNLEYG